MSSISRSLVILTLKRPPGPAVRTGPFQSSAGCLTKSASPRLRRRRLKLATITPVFAATPTQRRTQETTRSWRCVVNPVSVYLSLCHRCFLLMGGQLRGSRRRRSRRKTPNTIVSLSGRRRPAVRERSLAVSVPPPQRRKQRGCEVPAPHSS